MKTAMAAYVEKRERKPAWRNAQTSAANQNWRMAKAWRQNSGINIIGQKWEWRSRKHMAEKLTAASWRHIITWQQQKPAAWRSRNNSSLASSGGAAESGKMWRRRQRNEKRENRSCGVK